MQSPEHQRIQPPSTSHESLAIRQPGQMESKLHEFERIKKEQERRIQYLENLAESLRRHIDDGKQVIADHRWSDRAMELSTEDLQKSMASYEERARCPDFETPYDCSSDEEW